MECLQGFDNILCDYLHPRKFPVLGPILTWTVRLLTGGALYGLYEFNTNDIGMLSYDYPPFLGLFLLICPSLSTGLTELVKKSWNAAS